MVFPSESWASVFFAVLCARPLFRYSVRCPSTTPTTGQRRKILGGGEMLFSFVGHLNFMFYPTPHFFFLCFHFSLSLPDRAAADVMWTCAHSAAGSTTLPRYCWPSSSSSTTTTFYSSPSSASLSHHFHSAVLWHERVVWEKVGSNFVRYIYYYPEPEQEAEEGWGNGHNCCLPASPPVDPCDTSSLLEMYKKLKFIGNWYKDTNFHF